MLLAGLAHTLGGGHLPNPAVLTMTAVLPGLVATTATARRCRFPLLVTCWASSRSCSLWLTAAVQAEAVCAEPGSLLAAVTRATPGRGRMRSGR